MNKITFENTYKNHPINSDKERRLGCYEKALEKIDTTIKDMIEKHSKVMVVRFDVRYPDNENIKTDNQDIYRFTYNLKRSLNREKIDGGHNVDAQIIHVEEKKTSNNPHHHYAVLVNGNAKNKYFPIVEKPKKI